MGRVGKADGGILRRHKEPCREQDVDAAAAEQIQDFPIGPLLGVRLTYFSQQLKKGPVIPVRVKVVDEQKQAAAVARNAGQMKGKQVFSRHFLPAQPVLKADLRDRSKEIFMKRGVNTGGIRRSSGVLQGKRSLAAAAVPGDPDGT